MEKTLLNHSNNMKLIAEPFKNSMLKGFIVLALILSSCTGTATAQNSLEKQAVNPHWSGNSCSECHIEKLPSWKGAGLRFNNDPIRLCNRCHDKDCVTTDIHPVEVAPAQDSQINIPSDWPLKDGKLTCLTCHDVKVQMSGNFAQKTGNSNFLRGAPFKALTEFCFICHQQKEYKKTNPHKQLDDNGNIIDSRCLFCHMSIPNPEEAKGISDVSFKSDLKFYCINCHAKEKTDHPGRSDHMIELPGNMKQSLLAQNELVHLPLDNNRIFCGTCHNPHEKGVIKNKQSMSGAGEDDFLRLNGGYLLCISCHTDKILEEKIKEQSTQKKPPVIRKIITSTHKPADEKKCKTCHVATAENMEKPLPVFLCFKDGCHKTNLIENTYTHDKAVLENCSLCHRAHSSVYSQLLRGREEKMCHGCHPQIRDNTNRLSKKDKILKTDPTDNETANETMTTTKTHSYFTQYFKTTPVSRDNECSFCHSPEHKKNIKNMDIMICADCHIFVHKILSKGYSVAINIHDTFETTTCGTCHNPHASQFKHLLKLDQEITRYRRVQPAAGKEPLQE